MFKFIVGFCLFIGGIYCLIEHQYSVAIAVLIVAVIFSKCTTGYYCLGFEDFLDSDSSSDSGSRDSGGGD